MCKTIKQKVKFKAPPRVVYDLLADSRKHTAVTGERAVISKNIGGKFSMESGRVTGVVVDLKPGERIVQAWRASDFPVGVYSMATFNFARTQGGGTELTLTHRGVPKDLIPEVEKKWRAGYWDRMRAFLSRR